MKSYLSGEFIKPVGESVTKPDSVLAFREEWGFCTGVRYFFQARYLDSGEGKGCHREDLFQGLRKSGFVEIRSLPVFDPFF